jgi:hypothetical protein
MKFEAEETIKFAGNCCALFPNLEVSISSKKSVRAVTESYESRWKITP